MILSILSFHIDQIPHYQLFGFGQMFNFVVMLILAEYSSITKCLDLKKTFGISQMFAFGRILKNSGSVILWTRYEE